MKSYLILLLMLISVSVFGQPKFATSPSWKTNFWLPGKIDSDDWTHHVGSFSKEIERYTDSKANVYVSGGYLHIKALRNEVTGEITSGRVHTLGKQSFKYGRLEIKAKLPTGKGIFPAIWMLRTDHAKVFPLGEIDIAEYIECFEQKQYCTTTHIVERKPGEKEIRHRHTTMVDADMTKFHVYALEWTPEALIFKLDGNEVFHVYKSEAEFWPFDAPYYLLLNVAYGSWGAQCGTDDSIFPREMLVDWIRYYPLVSY